MSEPLARMWVWKASSTLSMICSGRSPRPSASRSLLVEAVGEIVDRSQSPVRDERLTTRLGCHNVSELVQRLTRCAAQTAVRLERAAKAVAPRRDVVLVRSRHRSGRRGAR